MFFLQPENKIDLSKNTEIMKIITALNYISKLKRAYFLESNHGNGKPQKYIKSYWRSQHMLLGVSPEL